MVFFYGRLNNRRQAFNFPPFPFCEPPGHLAMNFSTLHLFGVFASYFEFAAFSRHAFPVPTADPAQNIRSSS
jgi:hypothetical protein